MAAYIAVERRIFRAIAPTLPPPPRFLTVIRLLYEMGKDPTSAVSVPPPHLSYVLPSRFKIILSRENFRYDVSNSSSRNLFNFDRTFSLTKLRLISIRYSANLSRQRWFNLSLSFWRDEKYGREKFSSRIRDIIRDVSSQFPRSPIIIPTFLPNLWIRKSISRF